MYKYNAFSNININKLLIVDKINYYYWIEYFNYGITLNKNNFANYFIENRKFEI